ncbi:hypothetical protein N7495_002957 [Penicillium taxi]|uniref:uncharacterized protein n=1 Tax=Penicillium taxi TaxID=168475 RepID=UPI002544E7F0|nr:uncharacterized protein N7495_002957 [Penicillium taxi]KAJ5902429.1 hypothetical protein N7495_002957 [Penicillium taxi]
MSNADELVRNGNGNAEEAESLEWAPLAMLERCKIKGNATNSPHKQGVPWRDNLGVELGQLTLQNRGVNANAHKRLVFPRHAIKRVKGVQGEKTQMRTVQNEQLVGRAHKDRNGEHHEALRKGGDEGRGTAIHGGEV